MDSIVKIPIAKFKQDPTDGLYKFGSIQLTNAEYMLALEMESIQTHIEKLEQRLATQESR